MRILFIAAEAAPLAKVGGLGDVVGSLPGALNQIGHDVRLIIPRYGAIDIPQFSVKTVIRSLDVQVGQAIEPVALQVTNLPNGITVYLVDSPNFSASTEVYTSDDLQRFLLFCRAVLQVLPKLKWQPDVVHCHDWHTALVPMWLHEAHPDYTSLQ